MAEWFRDELMVSPSESPGFIIVVIIMWTREKPSEKKKTLTFQLSGSLIGSNGLIYSKSRA